MIPTMFSLRHIYLAKRQGCVCVPTDLSSLATKSWMTLGEGVVGLDSTSNGNNRESVWDKSAGLFVCVFQIGIYRGKVPSVWDKSAFVCLFVCVCVCVCVCIALRTRKTKHKSFFFFFFQQCGNALGVNVCGKCLE